ncbi:extracellular scp domain containing protein [Grosmannia clavigera kw1407]|uniref:Extracellular scp domain containing protein n=1 Tax=Grosmannia clavigera (strain kw1407 / UAMH 11150) TaxID=655863 RepID=F0X9P6_GROCL|nr:extracellular scp domain containing protein [Grosmannia clavigera kw1407]EFX06028.1 extracellular scp domain containing protein [Grosmannia clavigera kw1407]
MAASHSIRGADGRASETTALSTVTIAATLPSAAPQFVNSTLFVSAILNSTNFFRSEHNATAATWNTTTAAFATAYLENDTDCTFAHSGGPYGENIAIGCSDAASCVDAWGNERREYDFSHPAFTEATGHFSQLVWKNSTTVGCGRRLCSNKQKNSGWFLVCEYWPRGNVIGQFGEEVGRQAGRTTESAVSADRHTSSGVILGSLVVFFLLVSALAGDAATALGG